MNNIRLIDYFAAHAMIAVIDRSQKRNFDWHSVSKQAYKLAFEMMRESKSRDNEGKELIIEANG